MAATSASKVTLTTSKQKIQAYVMQSIERRKKDAVTWLAYVGEQCINDARLNHSYKTQTANLQSSTGYVIVDNGEIVAISSFPADKGTKKDKFGNIIYGVEGSKTGKAYAESLAKINSSGLVLIVVAGMNYARYVADKGYNVLDSAQALAEKLIPQLLSR